MTADGFVKWLATAHLSQRQIDHIWAALRVNRPEMAKQAPTEEQMESLRQALVWALNNPKPKATQ